MKTVLQAKNFSAGLTPEWQKVQSSASWARAVLTEFHFFEKTMELLSRSSDFHVRMNMRM
jgi:hypothetical protein